MADLFARFSSGDVTAVTALYEEYGRAVYSVALSILGDNHLAADATQETFVKAWNNAASFDQSKDFGPWIYTIARRTAIDMLRRGRKVTPRDTVEIAEFPEGVERAWEVFEVRQAVDRLPEEERAVVRLTHLEGLTHTEAAEQLGIPVGTVKSRSNRAHRRLASWLGHMIEEP